MINQKIDYTIGFHREKAVIFIGFKIDNELIAWVKKPSWNKVEQQ